MPRDKEKNMIKSSALKLVSRDSMGTENKEPQYNQNIRIEYSDGNEYLPASIEEIAVDMLKNDRDIRDVLKEIRRCYSMHNSYFNYSLAGMTDNRKNIVISFFQQLRVFFSSIYYSKSEDCLKGQLAFAPNVQRFWMGEYLEIAVKKIVSGITSRLGRIYGKEFKVYNNVKVTTKDGLIKNEFDTVIENITDGIVYVIEAKSGDRFNDYDKLRRIGIEYNIVPNRLVLIDTYLTESDMDLIHHLYEYYATNLAANNLERVITDMLEKDLAKEK